ncbi:MAG TPA: LTA synthase family protein [Stellaceae bacterium]|nr:LTA synthase family protein [Stellaceae bacterium]
MIAALNIGFGIALLAAAWLLPRRVARARLGFAPALVIDAAPFVTGFLVLTLASARPLFAGLVIFALGAGFTLADLTMRKALREPVVFQAVSELPQVFTHPQLYLPYAGPALVVGGALAMVAVALGLLVFTPAIWPPMPFLALAWFAAIIAGFWLFSRQPMLGRLADLFRHLPISGDPDKDAATLGPFAMLVVHCALARDERAERQHTLRPRAVPTIMRGLAGSGSPIVLVQCESFFDARRLTSALPRALLPGFEACCTSAAYYGRLKVPGWGANTMRSEFAVLTGISEDELGFDRFNPYYALARVPVASHVWRLRQAGYRTICLHPFSSRFFRRDLVMPALGFDLFLGRDVLGGAKAPPYQSDPDLARQVLEVIDGEGPRCFVFVITMGNHGPWSPGKRPLDEMVTECLDPSAVPAGGELLRYLDGLRRSDEMLRILMSGLAERDPDALLGFYGDHLPSLPLVFDHFGFSEPHSDYAIWSGRSGAPQRLDLPAHQLGNTLLTLALDGRSEVAQRERVRLIG